MYHISTKAKCAFLSNEEIKGFETDRLDSGLYEEVYKLDQSISS